MTQQEASAAREARARRVVAAIEAATHQYAKANAPQVTDEQQQVLLRILGQRARIARRELSRAQAKALRPSSDAQRLGASLAADVRESWQSHPAWLVARDYVQKHPVLLGLALGSVLIAGPRKILRAAVWAAPLAIRLSRYTRRF